MKRKDFLSRLPAMGMLPFVAGQASFNLPESGKIAPQMNHLDISV